MCESDLCEKKILKRDIEGFLSAFNYSMYGATNINDIASLVYTRDDLIPQRLSEKKRPNAPPQDLNKDIDPKAVEEKECHNQRIRSLLNQMEDKVFNGKVKLFQVFRKFDNDKDGYISYEDFHHCLNSIKVHADKKEIASMVKLIDPSNQGYLTFTQFQEVFSPSMSDKLVNVPQNDTYHPNLCPTRAVNAINREKQTHMQDAIHEIRKGFQPDVDKGKLNFQYVFSSCIFDCFQNWLLPHDLAQSLTLEVPS